MRRVTQAACWMRTFVNWMFTLLMKLRISTADRIQEVCPFKRVQRVLCPGSLSRNIATSMVTFSLKKSEKPHSKHPQVRVVIVRA